MSETPPESNPGQDPNQQNHQQNPAQFVEFQQVEGWGGEKQLWGTDERGTPYQLDFDQVRAEYGADPNTGADPGEQGPPTAADLDAAVAAERQRAEGEKERAVAEAIAAVQAAHAEEDSDLTPPTPLRSVPPAPEDAIYTPEPIVPGDGTSRNRGGERNGTDRFSLTEEDMDVLRDRFPRLKDEDIDGKATAILEALLNTEIEPGTDITPEIIAAELSSEQINTFLPTEADGEYMSETAVDSHIRKQINTALEQLGRAGLFNQGNNWRRKVEYGYYIARDHKGNPIEKYGKLPINSDPNAAIKAEYGIRQQLVSREFKSWLDGARGADRSQLTTVNQEYKRPVPPEKPDPVSRSTKIKKSMKGMPKKIGGRIVLEAALLPTRLPIPFYNRQTKLHHRGKIRSKYDPNVIKKGADTRTLQALAEREKKERADAGLPEHTTPTTPSTSRRATEATWRGTKATGRGVKKATKATAKATGRLSKAGFRAAVPARETYWDKAEAAREEARLEWLRQQAAAQEAQAANTQPDDDPNT